MLEKNSEMESKMEEHGTQMEKTLKEMRKSR